MQDIEAALEEQRKPSAQETLRLHQAEDWRDRLIADDATLNAWLAQHGEATDPADLQQLRALIRQARKDAASAKPEHPGEAQPHQIRRGGVQIVAVVGAGDQRLDPGAAGPHRLGQQGHGGGGGQHRQKLFGAAACRRAPAQRLRRAARQQEQQQREAERNGGVLPSKPVAVGGVDFRADGVAGHGTDDRATGAAEAPEAPEAAEAMGGEPVGHGRALVVPVYRRAGRRPWRPCGRRALPSR